ncbi:hydantoinase B/oxoprolinase family protein [Aminobacter sp. AP02]|uniref:hydantoinase B/oxoprolinase family protein n=1 Tax=Aminobacter sp. AP02 TaxID=2135737 RepID=UPI000D6C2E66|nr:hydantoinase B/oxoprolinase family protein [Aminobacter sp. AP02]PWK60349.1 N-methylhydantoinase B [Aminobacter sp. AP02]
MSRQVGNSTTQLAQNDPLGSVQRQVMWNRLIAVVEQQAQTLIRSSFSTSTREAGDLSAGIFDTHGRMIAQAVTGTPGHVNSMAVAVRHFIKAYPIGTMAQGDAYITNDPWLASGHLFDITVVTPAFFDNQIVGLFASTIHLPDVGGRGMGTEARQVFEEGLAIPIMPIARRGEMNEDLLKIIRANSREPVQCEGDVYSAVAAGEAGAGALVAMMEEFNLDTIEELANYILATSEAAVRAEIAALPDGVYRNTVTLDGYDSPIIIAVSLTIAGDQIHLDFDGTSPQSAYGINVVLNYTQAYSTFGVRCLIGKGIPNNWGSLAPITVGAPEGCILNAMRPAPVAARHILGYILPDAVFGCLQAVMPEHVPAEGSLGWNQQFRGASDHFGAARTWEILMFSNGGMGAQMMRDGLSTTGFPAGLKSIPIEAAEAAAPIVFWRKELLPDSAGAGKQRGGYAQVVEVASLGAAPLSLSAMFDRIVHPPRGRDGGENGRNGALYTGSGSVLAGKGLHKLAPGERVIIEHPGGGGFGDPFTRDLGLIREELRSGLLSSSSAKAYGVVCTSDGVIDEQATQTLRNTRSALASS